MVDVDKKALIEGAMHVEGSPDVATHRGGARLAREVVKIADKDPQTALEMASGREVNIEMIKINSDESIGWRNPDGTLDMTDADVNRRRNELRSSLKILDDYIGTEDFSSIAGNPEGQAIMKVVSEFFMNHPATRDFIAGQADSDDAARAIAESYLNDPKAREQIVKAIQNTRLNSETIGEDERRQIEEQSRELEDIQSELKKKEKRRKDLVNSSIPGNRGSSGELIDVKAGLQAFEPGQPKANEISTLEGDIQGLGVDVQVKIKDNSSRERKIRMLEQELRDVRRGAGGRTLSEVQHDINDEEQEIESNNNIIAGKEQVKAQKESELQQLRDKKSELQSRNQELESELQGLDEEIIRLQSDEKYKAGDLAALKRKKAQLEQEIVAEISQVFGRGVEKRMQQRFDAVRQQAISEAEDKVEREEEADAKRYQQSIVTRYVTKAGNKFKINGTRVENDYNLLTGDPLDVTIDGTDYYLTGPEQVVVRAMTDANMSPDFIKSKLNDSAWMESQGQEIAKQVLREKYAGGRGLKGLLGIGEVKRMSKGEVERLARMPWAEGWIEDAVSNNEQIQAQLEQALGSGAIKTSERGWLKKLGKGGAVVALLLILGIGGVMAVT